MGTSAWQLSEEIDRLFERYLSLLDQYDSLHKRLRTLQSSTLQNIARANFEAPRGTRYGEDLYDARMQATRLCCVTEHPETAPADFTISTVSASRERAGFEASESTGENDNGDGDEKENAKSGEEKATNTDHAKARDPIRMFGILNIPSSLRMAQNEAINMVNIIPQLATIDAQMKETEIQIRRARKRRIKAESTEKAQQLTKTEIDLVTAT